jgi:ubiquinone/menaquinone biosynthesis C-methylase UbiE
MADAVAAGAVPHPDYGLDAPPIVHSMFSRGAWTFGIGLAMFLINRSEYPQPAWSLFSALGSIGLVFLAVGAFMVWSSRVAKLKLRDELIDSLALKGDEKILDVGCGRGLLLIGAAKRLSISQGGGKAGSKTAGKATGIDIWSDQDLSGNSADATKQNAKLEGVSDRVRVETGDARKLVYPDANYDVVMSSLAIHNIPEREERQQAIAEMWRVLKPGGKLLIFDILKTGEYARVLRERGANDVTLSGMKFLWCIPSRILTARKPN